MTTEKLIELKELEKQINESDRRVAKVSNMMTKKAWTGDEILKIEINGVSKSGITYESLSFDSSDEFIQAMLMLVKANEVIKQQYLQQQFNNM